MKLLVGSAVSNQSQVTGFRLARGVAIAYFATVTRRGNEFIRLSESLLSPQSGYSLKDVEETFGVPFDALRDELVERRAPSGTYDVSMLIEIDVHGHWNSHDERAEFINFDVKHVHIASTSSEREMELVIGANRELGLEPRLDAFQTLGGERPCQL